MQAVSKQVCCPPQALLRIIDFLRAARVLLARALVLAPVRVLARRAAVARVHARLAVPQLDLRSVVRLAREALVALPQAARRDDGAERPTAAAYMYMYMQA